jgi:hypothetical protein
MLYEYGSFCRRIKNFCFFITSRSYNVAFLKRYRFLHLIRHFLFMCMAISITWRHRLFKVKTKRSEVSFKCFVPAAVIVSFAEEPVINQSLYMFKLRTGLPVLPMQSKANNVRYPIIAHHHRGLESTRAARARSPLQSHRLKEIHQYISCFWLVALFTWHIERQIGSSNSTV